jgi:hypothetical protein
MVDQVERALVNIETLLENAISESLFRLRTDGTPSLGILLGQLGPDQLPQGMPSWFTTRASKIVAFERNVAKLTTEDRHDLGGKLVSLLRFVCHRGERPNG